MALLAATTLGVDGADTVRAEVIAEGGLAESRDYRLVVQSYDDQNGEIPGLSTRPVASYQRAVTAAELREGVRVSLVELRQAASVGQVSVRGARVADPVIVAWVEDGKPDLEFDARTARPRPGGMVGVAKRGLRQASVQIRLSGKVAA